MKMMPDDCTPPEVQKLITETTIHINSAEIAGYVILVLVVIGMYKLILNKVHKA